MIRLRLLVLLAATAASSLALAHPTLAAGFGITQHGGRATGQVGAFVARADDATAVSYNPAALVRLEAGLQATVGLDFSAPRDDYESASGAFAANHIIAFVPAVYLGWRPEGASWALGLSLDSPMWYLADWRPVDFPGRFRSRRTEVTLFELHPTFAWALDDRWSVGGGLRYVRGTLGQGENQLYAFPGEFGDPVPLEVQRLAETSSADGLGFDLAAHFASDLWGFGASLRSAVEIEGQATVEYVPLRLVDPVLTAIFERDFVSFDERLEFTLPTELRVGGWVAPYPELRLELDLGYTRWSELDDSTSVFNPRILDLGVVRERNWDDVLAARLGVEGDLDAQWSIFGGLAWEPSPVDGATLEPGFPRGDALVYAVGVTWRAGRATFDVGYSFWDHQGQDATGQEPLAPTVRGSYSSHDQVWSASARLTL
jgi:long-chain fatty acid transport protein